jgi:polyisoprenoid-binding protein YceI
MKGFFTLVICFYSLGTIHAQQYQPADDKSSVTFTIKNFGVNTGGAFKGLAGTIEFDKANPEKAVFDISVAAATVNTDNSTRDNHLRKEEYFDAEKFPELHFKSDKVISRGNGFSVSGKLTIKGTTKNISFPFTASPEEDGLLFEGNFEINRLDFKVGGSSMVLADKVTVKLSVAAKKK